MDDPSTVAVSRPTGPDSADLRAVVPALTIAWHHDVGRVGAVAPLGPGTTEISRRTPPFDSATDVALSRNPFLVVEHRDGQVELRRPAGTSTSIEVDGTALGQARLVTKAQLEEGVMIAIADAIVVCLHRLRVPVLRGPAFGLVGASDAMESVRRQIAQVADLDVPVLIRGETGTGKEMVARAIAAGSGRAEPFVAVNMAAVPPSTAAAELFGHERGAFTGATETRPGYFGEADGGTLFLDEIGATPPDVQPMLLRTLETWEVRPLGGRKARKVRVRLVTATDADLDAAVKRGQFSEPLLHRLSGYQIALPPLRARREDIGPLFLHFLEQELATTSELDRLEPREPTLRPWLGARDAARLFGGTWPGNVRRLRNVARQLVISSRGRPFAEIDMTLRDLVTASTVATTTVTPPRSVRQGRVTDEEIWDALVTHDFNHAAAAEALGIHRSTLYERLEANPQGLRTAAQLTDDEILRAFERHGKDITAMARELHCSPKPLKSRLTAALKSRPKGGQ